MGMRSSDANWLRTEVVPFLQDLADEFPEEPVGLDAATLLTEVAKRLPVPPARRVKIEHRTHYPNGHASEWFEGFGVGGCHAQIAAAMREWGIEQAGYASGPELFVQTYVADYGDNKTEVRCKVWRGA